MRLSDFERAGAAFCAAVNRERYLQGAGLKPALELAKLYDDYRQLFDLETFHFLREVLLDERLGPNYRRFLLDFAAAGCLDYAVREHTEALASAEASTVIEWGGQPLAYRAAPVVWLNEPDADRRHELYDRWRAACAELNGRRAERWRARQALVPELGYDDPVALWDQLRDLRLQPLAEQASALLAQTADLYREHLRSRLAEHRLDLATAQRVDLAYLLRGPEYDAEFPKQRLVATLVTTLRDLGFELEEQRQIRLDLEPRSTKSPRAFCARLAVPADVRLVVQPVGGHQDYATLLHEAGHAEHFGNTDSGLPFAHRWLGDASVTEGYAFLLHYLTTDPHWLRRVLGLEQSDDYRRFALFGKLQILRRYAAKLLYELELQRAEQPEPLAEQYAELLSYHQQVRYSPDEYLADVDDNFYVAQYLRAWIFEAQLRAYLKREYDEEWFRAPRAGRFVRDLWRQGQRHTADELARFMGYEGLDAAALVGEIEAVLAR